VDQAGGKALALMQMTGAGMPVPPGLVLTVAFFEPWTARLRDTREWAAPAIGAADGIGPATKALQAACHTLHFTDQQNHELDGALRAFREQDRGRRYAVRSSSPEEDLEGASFAGGYETVLGVTTEGIEAAILHAFTSSFDERVFLYKRESGIRLDLPRIAVIVQAQVDADSAGVAFSLNPLNNGYDEVVINASHGLGESVVSGDADPDVFVVDKVRGEIIETRIGAKQAVVSLDAAGGLPSCSNSSRAWPRPFRAQIRPSNFRGGPRAEGVLQDVNAAGWRSRNAQALRHQGDRPVSRPGPGACRRIRISRAARRVRADH